VHGVLSRPENASRRTEIVGHRHRDVEYHRHVVTTGPDSRARPSGLLQIGRGDPHRALVAVRQFGPVTARRVRHK
jgi:hypothetical protein